MEAEEERPACLDDPIGPQLLQKWRKEASQRYLLEPELEEIETVELDDDALSNVELREKYVSILGNVKCALIDLDGTLFNIRYEDIAATRSAVEAFKKLRESEVKVVLVANTWLESKQRTLEVVRSVGFDVEEKDLFTSADCCKIFMKKHSYIHPFLLVTDDVQKDFEAMGTVDPNDFDCVVVGLPSTMIDYRLMTKALNMLFEGRPMLILHSARSDKAVGSNCVLGPGIFSHTLEFATDAKRFIPAKPTAGFYIEACKYAGFSAQECLMIGDEIADDVRDAKSICMKAALVKTGKYRAKDERKFCNFKPDVVAEDFATLVKFLLCAKSKDSAVDLEEAENALRKARMLSEQNDFNMRLAAYAADDCNRKKSVCPPKMPSFIW